MKTLLFFAFPWAASIAGAATIPGLFNTGLDSNGVVLAAGSQDPHYLITAAAQGPINTGAIVILNHPAWLANSAASSWIGVLNPGSANVNAGDYNFRMTFDLTGLEPSTAQISFMVSVDNDMSDVLINGQSAGLSFSGFGGFSPAMTITSGFVDGTNTLEFRMVNGGPAANPAGFRVEFISGTADLQPPAGTPPTIVTSPASQTVGLGDSLLLGVSATGSRPFAYQWRFNGSPIVNATNSTFVIATVSNGNSGNYDVIVSNTAGAPTSGVAVVNVVFLSAAQRSYEPAGPSTRRSGVTISEIMYHPTNRADLRNGEFIELYNSNPFAEDLSGYRLSGAFNHTFAEGASIPGLGYLVVAPVPADVMAIYGISGVLGGDTNNLSNDSGTIRLRKKSGGVVLEVNYSDQPPWPAAADRTGHSLVLARPSYGENDPQSWAASDVKGGSPGTADPVPSGALENVVINEILAHTDAPLSDYVELHNHSPLSVDVSGAWLSDSATTNKFEIPPSTVLPPGGFVSFEEAERGFALGANGETVYFSNPAQTRVVDALRYQGQANGVALGRWPDGEGAFRELSARTPGTNNAVPLARPIVINEIMYNPISGDDDDQYVEVHNRSGSAVNLGGWQFTAGIDYRFPANTMLAPGGYLVVARNASRMMTNYTGLNAGNLFGNFGGRLSHGGERVALGMPDYSFQTNAQTQVITSNVAFYVVMNEVTYGDGGRWGRWSDGGGSSLELVDTHSDNRLAPNWADSDETAKSQWTSFEHTGVLDLGHPDIPSISQFHFYLMDAGEAMVDDLEVISSAVNRVSNPGFESGTNGWTFRGTQRTSYSTNGGFSGANALRLVATSRGDVVNRAETTLTAVPAANSTVTLRAKARWLRGHPELMLRLIGNSLEAVGRLSVPRNLGTPGTVNSRARANLGPVITEVTHRPVLPQAGQTIRVTARVQDVDGVQGATLVYRVDPSATLNSVPMNDSGTNGDLLAGDGIHTGLIPGQSSGVIVAFRVQATDSFAPIGTTQFPEDAPVRECLVRVGESVPPGAFITYRMWMTQATFDRWSAQEKSSNEDSDTTFAYGNYRVVYNVGVHYGSSQNYSTILTTPTGTLVGYNMSFPEDDLLLGASGVRLDWPNRDTTQLREVTMYWLLDQYGLPNHYRRFIHLHINGVKRGTIYNDSQRPNADSIEEWYPDDTEGELFKLNPWYEANTSGAILTANFIPPRLLNTTTTGGATKTAYYRYAWLPRAVNGSANNYSNLFAMIAAANAPSNGYQSAVECVIDIPQWMRTFAMNDLASYWDAFGNPNYKNSYLYRPDRSGWKVMCWDFDVGLGTGNGGGQVQERPTAALFDTGDLALQRMNATPFIVRHYWAALDEAVYSFFQASAVQTFLADRYAAFQAAGIAAVSPFVPSGTVPTGEPQRSIPDWITARRDFLLTQLATVSNVFNVTGTNYMTTGTNLITLTGTAPVRVNTITVNGVAYTPIWTTVNSWRLQVPVFSGTNDLVIAGLDRNGNVLSNLTVTVEFIGPNQDPADFIVINEIMYNPLLPGASYIELFNRSTNHSFDLSGWRLNGIDLTFPPGTIISNGHYLVMAKDRSAFGAAYGWHLPVLCEFDGQLDNGGETLTLFRPGATTNDPMIVVDNLRYDSTPPWSTNANGTGSSLQLVDPGQENARVANWWSSFVPAVYTGGISTPPITNAGWRFVSATGIAGPGVGGTQMRLVINLGVGEVNGASVVIDDIMVVPGTNAGVGTNYVRNGDFETGPLLEVPAVTNSWHIGTNYTNTLIVSDPVHGGSGALKIDCLTFGNAQPRVVSQLLSPAPLTNAVHTLSFWFNATNMATNLTVKLLNSSPLNITTNVQVTITPSNYVPATLVNPATNSLSPGVANQNVTNLSLPPLWINEVQAENLTGLLDSYGQPEPWIEIYNPSTNTVPLEGLYLSDNYTNLTQWAFPPGASIGPTQFLVIFCDGQPLQTSNSEYHTSFRLTPASGAVVLSMTNPTALPAVLLNPTNRLPVLDYVNYAGLHSDRSYGSFPDGRPFERMEFFYVTPGGTNDGRSAPLQVFINEWMASNTGPFSDPADDDFDDWFELYNPTTNTVELAGYYLTDTLTNKFKYLITTNGPHTIGPLGFLLVWADNETGQNTVAGVPRPDLHVNFQLAKAGEAIGLFAADGTQIDAIIFTNELDNVSSGRFPDGSANGSPNFYEMTNTTPRLPNLLAVVTNTPPVLDPNGDLGVYLGQTLTFTATASDADLPAQVLGFTLDVGAPPGASIHPNSGAFTWTPTAVGTSLITVRVTDNGSPTASDIETITMTVLAAPGFSHSARNGNDFELTWGTYPGKKYAVEYKDDLNAPVWIPLETNTAAGTSLSYTNTTGVPQRFFHLRVVE